MDDEYFIKTLRRNIELSAKLKSFWDAKLQMFIREEEPDGLFIGLIPQLFNIKIVAGRIEFKDHSYDDGY